MCQCGQTRPSVSPDRVHSVALLARRVAEAVPESPTQDARGNALQQALIWSGSPPGRAQLPKPLPLPPAQREGRTQNMRSTLIKNCCETGAESGQNEGQRMPWRRQNKRQQAWPQLASPGGDSCFSSRKILGSTCKTAESGKSLKPGPAHRPGQQPTLWEEVCSV